MAIEDYATILSPAVYVNEDGAVRMRGTRLCLTSIACGVHRGDTPDQIQHSFPTVELADIQTVWRYFSERPGELDALIEDENAQFEQARRDNEKRFPSADLKRRLMARRDTMLQRK